MEVEAGRGGEGERAASPAVAAGPSWGPAEVGSGPRRSGVGGKGVLGTDLGGAGGRKGSRGGQETTSRSHRQEARGGVRGRGEEVPSWAGHSQRLGWGGAGDGEQI